MYFKTLINTPGQRATKTGMELSSKMACKTKITARSLVPSLFTIKATLLMPYGILKTTFDGGRRNMHVLSFVLIPNFPRKTGT